MVDGVTLGPTSFLIGEGPELMNYPTTELFTPVQFFVFLLVVRLNPMGLLIGLRVHFFSRSSFWVTKLPNTQHLCDPFCTK